MREPGRKDVEKSDRDVGGDGRRGHRPAAHGHHGVVGVYHATATPCPNAQEAPRCCRQPVPRWAPRWSGGRRSPAGLSEQNLPGLSVAVGVGGDIVWAEGFGWADLDTGVPVAPATRFRIGTASIAFTSAAVGLLVEKGQLKLDDEIRHTCQNFPKKPWPVTLRQLMGHMAGVSKRQRGRGAAAVGAVRAPRGGAAALCGGLAAFHREPSTAIRATAGSWGARPSKLPRTSRSWRSCGSRSSSRWAWPTREPTRRPRQSPIARRPSSRGLPGIPGRPGPDARDRLSLLCGIQRVSVYPSDMCALAWRSTAARSCNPPRSSCSGPLSGCRRARSGLRSWLGPGDGRARG